MRGTPSLLYRISIAPVYDMRVVFDDIGNLHRNDVQFGIALAVARLDATEAQSLHVHALASGNVCRRYEVQPSVFGGEFY